MHHAALGVDAMQDVCDQHGDGCTAWHGRHGRRAVELHAVENLPGRHDGSLAAAHKGKRDFLPSLTP